MKIGIVTEPPNYTGKTFWRRILNIPRRKEIKNNHNPFELIVLEIPIPLNSILELKPRKLERKLTNYRQSLLKKGIDRVIFSKFIKEVCKEKNIFFEDIYNKLQNEYFLRVSPLCIRDTAKQCSIDLMRESVCIRSAKLDRISEYLMQQLCFDTNNIFLSTQNIKEANALCEQLYDETGLLIKVLEYPKEYGRICIDTDTAEISFDKNLHIRELDLGFDLGGYEASQTEIAAFLKDFAVQKPRCIYSHKK